MVRIGIVGIGFMGMIHYQAASKLASGRVVAVCSRDPKKLAGDWTSIQGNFGPRGGQVDLSAQAKYADVAELLGDPEIDLVDLCVPNDNHARLAIQALEAGKHVLVEKPIALTTEDADAMVAAANASGKLLMVGHVLPFFPEFAFAREAIASGRYGRLKAAHLNRVIARPEWSSGIADADRSGGPAIDLHIHDTHFVGLVCGVPKAVHSRGVVEGDAVVHLSTQYLFDDPNLAVSAVSGALSQQGRPFTHGFEFYLERATLSYDFANLGGQGHLATPLSVILPDGTVERPDLPGSGDPVDAFVAELEAAVGAVASGIPSPMLSGELARQALRTCHAEVRSATGGGVVALGD
ncbi:Gfo/Idh/MocA family protein [Tundrisphaera lichenicola]|uniref:Gfo/Idh/MocA family protein n=1 Tax=Tundrisphaera lichenicola TaxID=2029860 RepID=UPI003EBAEF55